MKRKIDLLKAMRTFVKVVEHQSFSAAARELDLVNSAVSRQVSDLEHHFDCQLLYRTTRAMHLTEEGRHYLDEFSEVLSRLDGLESQAQTRQTKIAGQLRITAPLHAGRLGIQNTLSDFLKLYPDVRLSWLLVNRYVNLVEEGIDMAIRVGALEDSSLIARRYSDLRVSFVASPGYLSEAGTPTHPRELVNHRCLSDSSNEQPGRWTYFDGKRERQIRVGDDIEVNLGHLVAEFAAAGHGVAYLPDFLVQHYIDSGKLVSILEPFQLPSVPISLVYPSSRMISPALKQLVQYLLDNRPKTDHSSVQ